jgi:hypothetical protein
VEALAEEVVVEVGLVVEAVADLGDLEEEVLEVVAPVVVGKNNLNKKGEKLFSPFSYI